MTLTASLSEQSPPPEGTADAGWDPQPVDLAAAAELSAALGLHPLVARVLAARGVHGVDSARAFLSPRLADLTQPTSMADRQVAAERLDRAIRARERIAIFGDYDVDGTTSAALLTSALRAMGGEVVPMVASRFDGGYGLSEAAAARLAEASPTLLVTCDCGTSDHDRLASLRARGIESIVVDHHKVPSDALPALAFLNPQRPDCGFPFKGLASVGLALSLAAAVRALQNAPLDLRTWLDLVAVGTIADVAPLQGDNRILTRAGLERMTQGKGRPGLRALAREARLRGATRAHDVGFYIAPMLNAPGRLGSAQPTLELLLADDDADAQRRARELVTANETRRKISTRLTEEAIEQVREVYGEAVPAGLVLAGQGWHPGVGGIVAGRLVERFGVPVIVVAFDDRVGVGSARAPKGIGLYDAVAACSSDLVQFGGHDGAAGIKVRVERLDALRAGFADACASRSSTVRSRHWTPSRPDVELTAADLAGPLSQHLDSLEPTGQAHPEPLVLIRAAGVGDVGPVGTGHLRAKVTLGRRSLRAFVRDGQARCDRGELLLSERGTADVVGYLRSDAYVGNGAVELELVATRPPR